MIREPIRIYDKRRKISQKVSAIPICRLEWGSQDPPLFPGLAGTGLYLLIYLLLNHLYLNLKFMQHLRFFESDHYSFYV